MASGYYLDSVAKLFKTCDVSCNKCVENSFRCSECAVNFYYKQGDTDSKCYNGIQPGFHLDTAASLFIP